MLQWLQEENEFEWNDWLLRPIFPKVVYSDESGQEGSGPGEQETIQE